MARVEEGGEERSAASSLDAPLKAASVSCGTSSSSSSRTSHLSSTVSAGAAAAARPSSPRSGEAGDCRASSVSAQKPESSLPRSRSGAEGVPLAEGRETESRGSARRVEGGGGVRGAAKAVGARGAESFWRSLGSAGAPGGGGGRVPALLKSALDECVRLNLGGVVAFPSRADTATEKAAASSLTCPVCGCSLAESRESGVAADGLLLTATLFADGRRVSPPTVLCPRPLRAASRAPLLFQRKKTPPVGSTAFAPATSAEEQRLQQQPHQRRLSCYPRPCVHSLVGSPPCCVAPEEAAASAEESGGDEGELSQRQSVAREPPSGGGDEECVCCGGVKTDCLGGLRFASLQQMLQVPSAPLGALSLNAFFVLAVFAHCDDAPAFADSAGDSEETTLAGSGWRLFGFALLSLHDRRGCLRQGRLLLPIHRVLLQVPLLPLCSKRAADPAAPSSGKGEGGSASPETPREKLVLFLRRLRDVCAPPSLAGVKGGGIFAEEGEAAASPFSGAGEDFPLSCEALLGLLVRQPQLLHGRQDAEEEDVLSAAASLSFSASPSPPLASCCASERLLPSVQTLALVAEAMRLCVDLDVRQRGVLNRPSAEPVEGAVQRRLQRSLWERLLLLQAEAQTVDDIIVRRLAAAESPTGSPQQGRRQREEAAAALAEATPAVLFGGFLYVELPFYGVPVMHAEERLLAASASNPAAVLESAERGGAFFSADLSSQSAPFVQQPWTLGRPVVPPFWSVSSLSASTQGATQGTLPSAAQQQRLAPVLPAQAARKIHLREMQTELEQRSRRQRQSSSASPQMEGAGPQPAESEKGKGGPRAANSLNWLNSSWGVPPLEGVGPRSASSLPSFQKGKDVCAAAAPAGTENSPLDKPTDLSLPSGGSSFVSAKNEPRRTQQRLLQQLTWQDVSEHPCIAARIQRRIFLCDAANAPSPVFPPFPSGSLAAAESKGRQPQLPATQVLRAFRELRALLPTTGAPLSPADRDLLWRHRQHLRREAGALALLLHAANLHPSAGGSSTTASASHPREALALLDETEVAALSVQDVLALLLFSKELETAAAAAAAVSGGREVAGGGAVRLGPKNGASGGRLQQEGQGRQGSFQGTEKESRFGEDGDPEEFCASAAAAVYARVKRLAVEALELAPDSDLLFFLPQLVQLMRTDQHATHSSARVASVLVRRSLTSPSLASAFFWLLQSEKDHSQDGHLFVRAEQRLWESLARRKKRGEASAANGGVVRREEAEVAAATLRLLERQRYCSESFAPLLRLSSAAVAQTGEGEAGVEKAAAEKEKGVVEERSREGGPPDAAQTEQLAAALPGDDDVFAGDAKQPPLRARPEISEGVSKNLPPTNAEEGSSPGVSESASFSDSLPRGLAEDAVGEDAPLEARRFCRAVESAIPLPFDPSLSLVRILSPACYVVKSSQYPLVIKGLVVPTTEALRASQAERTLSSSRLNSRQTNQGPRGASGGAVSQEAPASGRDEAENAPPSPSSADFSAALSDAAASEVSIRRFLYKAEDDLRQDVLVLQLLSYMGRILLRYDLDLKLTTYKVVAFSATDGMIEFLDGCVSFAQVKRDYKSLAAYMASVHPDPNSPRGFSEEARGNFIASCAGYCVATYLLGVGDRHLDNILLMPDGRMLHVDFGFILGEDPKPFPPPMKICSEMLEVLGALDSEEFSHFLRLCCLGFKYLRRHAHEICLLLECMATSGLKDIAKNLAKVPDTKLLLATNQVHSVDESNAAAHSPALGTGPSPSPKSVHSSLVGTSQAGSGTSSDANATPGNGAEGSGVFFKSAPCLPYDPVVEGSNSFSNKTPLDARGDMQKALSSAPAVNADSKTSAKTGLAHQGGCGMQLPSAVSASQGGASGSSTFRGSATFSVLNARVESSRSVCVAIEKVRERFRLDLIEEDAEEFLVSVIISSAKALFPAVVDKLHEWSLYWK